MKIPALLTLLACLALSACKTPQAASTSARPSVAGARGDLDAVQTSITSAQVNVKSASDGLGEIRSNSKRISDKMVVLRENWPADWK